MDEGINNKHKNVVKNTYYEIVIIERNFYNLLNFYLKNYVWILFLTFPSSMVRFT